MKLKKKYAKIITADIKKVVKKELKKQITPDIITGWFDCNNPDSDGDFMNEISGLYTASGRPHTFTVPNYYFFKVSDNV